MPWIICDVTVFIDSFQIVVKIIDGWFLRMKEKSIEKRAYLI